MSNEGKKNKSVDFFDGIRKYISENRKKIVLVSILVLASTAVILTKSVIEYNQRYLFEDKRLVGIKEDSGYVPVIIGSTENKKTTENSAVLDTRKKEVRKEKREETEKAKSYALNVSKLMNYVKSSDELRKDGYIMLPETFEKSKGLKWKAPFDYSFLYLLLLLPTYVFLDYRRSFEVEEKKKKNFKSSVIRKLPAFSDNIILLLESGLVFTDAFSHIAKVYSEKEKRDLFEQMIVDVTDECKLTKDEYTSVMCRYAAEIKIREFSRLCSILSENQKKGIGLVDKLRNESIGLWENRKKIATERGKLAETKLSFPLSLLLVALILITAAPAFMQM